MGNKKASKHDALYGRGGESVSIPTNLTRPTWAARKRAFVAHMKRCWIYYVFVLPAVLTLIISEFMRKKKWIKEGDMKLDI